MSEKKIEWDYPSLPEETSDIQKEEAEEIEMKRNHFERIKKMKHWKRIEKYRDLYNYEA